MSLRLAFPLHVERPFPTLPAPDPLVLRLPTPAQVEQTHLLFGVALLNPPLAPAPPPTPYPF